MDNVLAGFFRPRCSSRSGGSESLAWWAVVIPTKVATTLPPGLLPQQPTTQEICMSANWRPVEGFPDYEVSDCGEVRSIKSGEWRVLKPFVQTNGYLKVQLFHDGRDAKFLVHRLVALAFIDNPLGLPQVNHIDGVKSNNRVQNLEWSSASGNLRHAHRTGLRKAAFRKQSEAVVAALMNGESVMSVASANRINPTTVRRIRERIGAPRWKPKSIPPEVVEQVRKFQGTLHECAARFGISKSSAHRIRRGDKSFTERPVIGGPR